MKLILHTAAVLSLVAAGLIPTAAQSAPAMGAIQVEPQQVGIGLTYDGATVAVRAEVPAGYQAALRLTSHPGPLELKRMGKKGGILWMGVGHVNFENVPALYHVLSTAPLKELGTPETLAAWNLGYDSLIPEAAPGADLRSDVIGLKEHEGLFSLQPAGLTRVGHGPARTSLLATAAEPGNGAAQAAVAGAPEVLQGSFHLPARAPAGDYTLELIGFKDGQAVHLGSTTLHLAQVGTVLELRRFALNHGLAYGIAACVIAIVVGLLTGLIFQPKSDEAH